MAKKTVVDWENLPKDEPVEVKGADIFLGYFDGMESDWGVRIRTKKDSTVYYPYNKYFVLPLNKEYVTVEEDWSSVKVDDKVKCAVRGTATYYPRHFAEIKNGKVWVFPEGKTSWTYAKVHPLDAYDISEVELIDE